MTSPTCPTIQDPPVIHAVVDEDSEVAAWVIEVSPEYVLTLFADGRSIYTTDSTENALDFVNLAEGLDCRLVPMITRAPSAGRGDEAKLR
ncbi:hypothetical protein ABZ816_19670 [Actinosynnema sp. NPDC047251]|nr:hypothetical protein [Saccharothrix espanaensis]